jgi:hypothetical protein
LEANKHSVDRLIFHCENELDGSLYVQNKDEITSRLQYSISTNSVMESFLDWIDEKL